MHTFMRRKSSAVSLFSTHDDSEKGVITIGMDFGLMSISANPKRTSGLAPLKLRRPESPAHLKTVDEDSDVDLNDYPITLDSFIPLAPPARPLHKKRSIGFFKRLRSGSTSSTASSSNVAPSTASPTSSKSSTSSDDDEPRSPLPQTTDITPPEIVIADEAEPRRSSDSAKRLRRRGHVHRASSGTTARRDSSASTQGRPSLEIITSCSSSSSTISSAAPITPRIQISHPFQSTYDDPTEPIDDPVCDSFLCLSPTEFAEPSRMMTNYEPYEDDSADGATTLPAQWEHPWKRTSAMVPIDWSIIEAQLGCAVLPAH